MNNIRIKRNAISTLLITLLVALNIAHIPANAESRLLWSDNPGAYEQHLIRRHDNPLFPKNRRVINQSEIDVARKRDIDDYKILEHRFLKLLEEIVEQPSLVDVNTIDNFRKVVDKLIPDAMGVGGKANDIAMKTRELRQSLIASWSRGVSVTAEAKQALEEAELYYHENAPNFEIPFIAQMGRDNSPIPNYEVVPALLMEEPDTIAMVISWLEPNKLAAVQQAALQVLKSALDEGAQIQNLDLILEALGINNN